MLRLDRKLGSIFAAALVACSAVTVTVPAQAQGSPCGDRVTVGYGDTFSVIARRCGTTITALMAANPQLPNPNVISLGTTIFMPGFTPGGTPVYRPPVSAPAVRQHIVRPGETVSSIARAYNLTLTTILSLNPGLHPLYLRVGERIVVAPGPVVSPPTPPPSGQPAGNVVRYVVRPGDTLLRIASMHNVTLSQIYTLNPNIDARYLNVGDVVRIPAGFVPPSEPQTVSLSPSSGAPGTVVRVSASRFPASTRLKVLVGRSAYSLAEVDRTDTDSRGAASVNVRIPQWAAETGSIVFAFEAPDGRSRAVSEPFRVTSAEPPRSTGITGTISREGTECLAMRGDDGRLYTLAGDTGGFRPGARVRVEGRIAEISNCQQGTTIDVRNIERLR